MGEDQVRGHCLCGQVRYVADGEPKWCAHCHCADCRRAVASAFATFVGFERNKVHFVAGQPHYYESSPGVFRSSCPNCGTPISYESKQFPGELHLMIGTLEDPAAFTPQGEVMCREKLPWLRMQVDGESLQGFTAEEESQG